ncbi:MAG: DoxX family membrane protein [Proteobacteria bacterium]|nr:DoxX family membrane protein [Pseudomonadota bacterium]
MKNGIKKIITHPYTALFCRIVLGGIFICASWDKILNPEQFAGTVENYLILPTESVNLFAIILPWLELICGIFLISGLFTGGTTLVIIFMMTGFLIALSSVLIRGIDTSCGCFSSNGTHSINILFLVRDTILFACALQVFFYDRQILSLDTFMKRSNNLY